MRKADRVALATSEINAGHVREKCRDLDRRLCAMRAERDALKIAAEDVTGFAPSLLDDLKNHWPTEEVSKLEVAIQGLYQAHLGATS